MFADGVAVKRIGDETFRLCQKYIDGHISVSSDEICAAVKDIFEDTRAIAEPSGAVALAGLKKYAEQNQLQGKNLSTVLSGANTNFHGLRYVSERCELGEKREGLLAVTIPERQGAFFEFCNLIGGRRSPSLTTVTTMTLWQIPRRCSLQEVRTNLTISFRLVKVAIQSSIYQTMKWPSYTFAT